MFCRFTLQFPLLVMSTDIMKYFTSHHHLSIVSKGQTSKGYIVSDVGRPVNIIDYRYILFEYQKSILFTFMIKIWKPLEISLSPAICKILNDFVSWNTFYVFSDTIPFFPVGWICPVSVLCLSPLFSMIHILIFALETHIRFQKWVFFNIRLLNSFHFDDLCHINNNYIICSVSSANISLQCIYHRKYQNRSNRQNRGSRQSKYSE